MKEDAIINDKFMKDFNLKMLSFNITPPEVKTEIVEIPYSNVFYDISELFGEITYKPRTISMVFRIITGLPCWHNYIDRLVNEFHGKIVTMRLASNSEWSYRGRCEIIIPTKESYYDGAVTINIIAEPYKFNKKGEKRL